MSATRNKRRGLQKLECPGCSGVAWMTWAMAEQQHAAGGLPVCSCGERFEPTDFELGLELGLEESGSVRAYHAAVASAMHGQAGRAHRWGAVSKDGTEWKSPDEIAAARITRERRQESVANQRRALRPAPEPMPF